MNKQTLLVGSRVRVESLNMPMRLGTLVRDDTDCLTPMTIIELDTGEFLIGGQECSWKILDQADLEEYMPAEEFFRQAYKLGRLR